MYKLLLFIFFFGMLLISCGEAKAPVVVPTATIPSLTPAQLLPIPALIGEIKLDTQTGTSYTLDWSHDGETLAAGSGTEITFLKNDLSGESTVIKPQGGALGVSWSPSGDQLATINGYKNPGIKIWDWKNDTLTLAQELDGGGDQYGVSWSPDGKLLATLGDDDKTTIQLWDTGTWEEVKKFELRYAYPRRALNWSADSTILYDAGEADGQVVIFTVNVSDGSVREILKFPVDQVYILAVSPDEKVLVIADERGTLRFVHLLNGMKITQTKSVDQPVDVVWHPDGVRLAILAYRTNLQLWEVSP